MSQNFGIISLFATHISKVIHSKIKNNNKKDKSKEAQPLKSDTAIHKHRVEELLMLFGIIWRLDYREASLLT